MTTNLKTIDLKISEAEKRIGALQADREALIHDRVEKLTPEALATLDGEISQQRAYFESLQQARQHVEERTAVAERAAQQKRDRRYLTGLAPLIEKAKQTASKAVAHAEQYPALIDEHMRCQAQIEDFLKQIDGMNVGYIGLDLQQIVVALINDGSPSDYLTENHPLYDGGKSTSPYWMIRKTLRDQTGRPLLWHLSEHWQPSFAELISTALEVENYRLKRVLCETFELSEQPEKPESLLTLERAFQEKQEADKRDAERLRDLGEQYQAEVARQLEEKSRQPTKVNLREARPSLINAFQRDGR